MSDLADEKYSIASLLLANDVFTLESLKEKLRVNQVPAAVLAVLDDLLTQKYIETIEGKALDFNRQTNNFDTRSVIGYRIIQDKREAFRKYVEELDKQRFQPDARGKPRGPHYRALEQLLEDVAIHPENLQQQETILMAYFELVQEDEVAEQTDPVQRAISEAYIRMLYGKFLEMKLHWEDALAQLLTSSRLFSMHGNEFEELRLATEQQACEILKRQYEHVQKNDTIDQLDNFIRAINKLKSIVLHNDKQLIVFFSLAEFTLQEIKPQRNSYYTSEERSYIEQYVQEYIKDKNEMKNSQNYVYERKSEQSLLNTFKEAYHESQDFDQNEESMSKKSKNSGLLSAFRPKLPPLLKGNPRSRGTTNNNLSA